MKRTFTILIISLLLLALAAPQAAAGDKDWATAGKILAGVVGVSVLHNALSGDNHHHRSHHHHRSYRSSSYYSYSSCSPSYTTYTRTYHRPRHHHSYTRTVVHPSPAPAPVYHSTTVVREPVPAPVVVAPAPVPVCNDPVIVKLEDGRRIYQPRIKGHVAYLQIYSEHSRDWVTLKEYPSLY